MALAVARGRRRDRFGRLGLEFDDVPRDEAQCLVHLVAAAMRQGMPAPSVAIDEALADGRRAPARPSRRAAPRRSARADASPRRWSRRAAPTTTLIAALAAEGDAALLAALCAVRAGIAPETAWMLLVNDGARDAMLLARLAGLRAARRRGAGRGAWPNPCCGASRARRSPASTRPPRPTSMPRARWWRLPPAYRDALDEQGGGDGQPLD